MPIHKLSEEDEQELVGLRPGPDWPVRMYKDHCHLKEGGENLLACVNLILGRCTIAVSQRAARAAHVKRIEMKNLEYYNTLPRFWKKRNGRN